MLFPKRVDIDKASVRELVGLFNDSARDLQQYIFMLDGQTISRGNIFHVRTLIQQRLNKLGVDVGNWISTEVPKQYIQGQHDAAKQQSSFGNVAAAAIIMALAANTGKAFNIPAPDKPVVEAPPTETVISPKQEMFDLHKQSVQSVMDSMSKSFGESLSAMSRSADRTVGSIQSLGIRRQIAASAQEGADTSRMSKQISDLIKNSDISALTDAAGRDWSPDSYAEMLVNTKLVEARNNGMMDAQQSAGEDLVEVSSHGAADVCGDWEGEILSISGDDPNYPSVDDATADGLFHPNCQHSLNAVNSADFPSTVSSDSLDMADLVAAL